MGIFGGIFGALMHEVSNVFGNGMVDDLDDVAIVEMFKIAKEAQFSKIWAELFLLDY